MKRLILILAVLSTATGAGATDEFRTHYVEARKVIDCRVYLPEQYDATREYPLVIALHGYGGSPANMAALWSYFGEHEFILALPEAPYAYAAGGAKSGTQFSWDFKGKARDLWPKVDPWVYEYVLQAARDLQAEYPVSQTVLLGHSQGVAYSYAAAFHSDGLIDGLICFAGRLPDPQQYPWLLDEEALQSGSELRVFLAHGKDDSVISSEVSLAAAKKLREIGCKVEMHLFTGGHSIPRTALAQALEWFGIPTSGSRP